MHWHLKEAIGIIAELSAEKPTVSDLKHEHVAAEPMLYRIAIRYKCQVYRPHLGFALPG